MISIIIPTLNEGAYLEATLKSLSSLGSFPHEIIISDGNSTDGTLDIAARYTEKITVWKENRRQTFGAAKNAGAALASGEYLLFMDADVVLKNPAADIPAMIAFFEERKKLAALSVPLKVRPEYAKPFDSFWIEPLNWWYRISNNWLDFATASGEFQMFRTTLFKQAGGFREDLVAGEDNDVFYRASRVGRVCIYTKSAAYHSCRRAHKIGWFRLYLIWARNGLSVTFLDRSAYKEWKVIR